MPTWLQGDFCFIFAIEGGAMRRGGAGLAVAANRPAIASLYGLEMVVGMVDSLRFSDKKIFVATCF